MYVKEAEIGGFIVPSYNEVRRDSQHLVGQLNGYNGVYTFGLFLFRNKQNDS